MDYYYQSKAITEVSDEIAEDVWYFRQVENPAYNVFDFGIQYKLFDRAGALREGRLKAWVNNILDEQYINSAGYPATGRNFGVAVQFGI